MDTVTGEALEQLVAELGRRLDQPVQFYLVGGSALLLLGSPRATTDVDYDYETDPAQLEEFRRIVAELANDLRLDLEFVPMAEFVPLPGGFEDRHQRVGQFGKVTLYVFDPYSLALSKMARGFEADLEDVTFLLQKEIIQWELLKRMFQEVLPRAWDADIDPTEFQTYFDEVARRVEEGLR